YGARADDAAEGSYAVPVVCQRVAQERAVRNLADRYADALVDVALSPNAAPEVRRQLGDFLELLRESPDLRLLLDIPAVSRPSKKAVVESLAVRMGASRTMRNF